MITFVRSFDYGLLTGLLRNPRLYDFLADDFSPPREEAVAFEHPALLYLLARDGAGLLGFFLLDPRSAVLYDVHVTMPLDRRALAAMRALLGPDGWIWSNTPCQRVSASLPAWNRVAQRFAYRAGLREFGRNPEASQKGRLLHDLVLMGIGRPGNVGGRPVKKEKL